MGHLEQLKSISKQWFFTPLLTINENMVTTTTLMCSKFFCWPDALPVDETPA